MDYGTVYRDTVEFKRGYRIPDGDQTRCLQETGKYTYKDI